MHKDVGPTHDAFDLFFKNIYVKNMHFSLPEVKADIYNFQVQNLFFTLHPLTSSHDYIFES